MVKAMWLEIAERYPLTKWRMVALLQRCFQYWADWADKEAFKRRLAAVDLNAMD